MKEGVAVMYTIPSCLAPGYYLVRHETIALHSAYSYPGAQIYPGCHQLQVTGTGTKKPTSLVGFPGAYKGSDPGITYDAYKGNWPICPSWIDPITNAKISHHLHHPRPSSIQVLRHEIILRERKGHIYLNLIRNWVTNSR